VKSHACKKSRSFRAASALPLKDDWPWHFTLEVIRVCGDLIAALGVLLGVVGGRYDHVGVVIKDEQQGGRLFVIDAGFNGEGNKRELGSAGPMLIRV
jgi:hypothetical protein